MKRRNYEHQYLDEQSSRSEELQLLRCFQDERQFEIKHTGSIQYVRSCRSSQLLKMQKQLLNSNDSLILHSLQRRLDQSSLSQFFDQFEYFGYSELAPINDSFGKSKLDSEIEFLMSKTAKRVEQVTAAMHMVELWFNTEAFDKNQQ